MNKGTADFTYSTRPTPATFALYTIADILLRLDAIQRITARPGAY